MVKICVEPSCNTRANFNYKDQKEALYCSLHKKNEMIDVKTVICAYPSCITRAQYNFKDKTSGIYCGKHKENGMINVSNKRCKDCDKIPIFNYKDEKYGIYCNDHKKNDMVNVKNKLCIHPNCNTRPTYNYEGEKTQKYCTLHKTADMVAIKYKNCLNSGCQKNPSFNYENETVPIYCVEHKDEHMIDIIHKKCMYPECQKQASYNFKDQNDVIYCSVHKDSDMINIKAKKCKYPSCNKIPHSNYKDEKISLYCAEHRKDGMINIRSKICKSPWCETQVNHKKYDGHCFTCYVHLFPDRPNARNYKTKERTIVDYVKTTFPDFTWVADRKVADGCSARRPDLLLDLGYEVIVVEVDENQHEVYDCSCENKRLMEISRDVGHRPLIFLRFNPDGYTGGENEKVKSCWSVSKQGLCHVNPREKKQWEARLETLKGQIEYWSAEENKSEKTLEVVHLYYDGFTQ